MQNNDHCEASFQLKVNTATEISSKSDAGQQCWTKVIDAQSVEILPKAYRGSAILRQRSSSSGSQFLPPFCSELFIFVDIMMPVPDG